MPGQGMRVVGSRAWGGDITQDGSRGGPLFFPAIQDIEKAQKAADQQSYNSNHVQI